MAEERVGLDEGAPAGDDFRAPVGDQVQRGELLEKPHRVLGGEHRDGSAEPQLRGFPGNGGQHYFGGGQGEVAPVVLAEAQEAQARLVRQLGELNDLFEPLLRRQRRAGAEVAGKLAEGKDAKVHTLLNIQALDFIPPRVARFSRRGRGRPCRRRSGSTHGRRRTGADSTRS